MEKIKTALLFAGQGSQYIGMGKDFYDQYPYVKQMYDEASSILGYDLADICFNANDKISLTLYTQPAILVTSCAILEVLKREFQINYDVVAGFSLGEYTALYASGIFSFQQIISLINKRALYMDAAAKANPGAMAAIIGLNRETLEAICLHIGEVVIANYNSPNQLVISGTTSGVSQAIEQAKASGAKRAIPLNVSGGFHSFLMHEAAVKMEVEVKQINYQKPSIPIVMNCNASLLDIHNLPELIRKQIESSVYWEDSIKLMIYELKINNFIEIGPGSVLTGLMKKIDPSKNSISISRIEDINNIDLGEKYGFKK